MNKSRNNLFSKVRNLRIIGVVRGCLPWYFATVNNYSNVAPDSPLQVKNISFRRLQLKYRRLEISRSQSSSARLTRRVYAGARATGPFIVSH